MKKFLAVLVVCSASQLAQANGFIPDDWSKADTARQTVVVATLAADMAQTLQIKNNPMMYEKNVVLGDHPSDTKVVAYFVGVALAHTYVATKVPAGWPRQGLQYGLIAMQVAQVIKNKRAGLAIKF